MATGCGGGTALRAPVAEPVPAAPAGPPPVSAEESAAAKAAIGELLVLAREQVRLGLVEEAADTWEDAVALATPLAERDAEWAAHLEAIEAEQASFGEVAARRFEAFAAERFERGGSGLLDEPAPALDPSERAAVTEAIQDLEPDWPVEINDRVLGWLEVYKKGGRLSNWFEGSLRRSGMYEERFREIFAEEGVPRDLIYLAHVESGFKTSAYSRARARGIFQFIASTGRRYGMRVDWWVDERAMPEKSCRASATYLRDLYAEFGDWYLALAAYNAGEGRVRRSIKKARTKDFWTLARRRFFRRETRNYVPAIIAATLISKNPAKFGFTDLEKLPPLTFEEVIVPDQADLEVLARAAGTDVRVLKQLNPALRRGQTPPKYPNYRLNVPVGRAAHFATELAAIPRDQWIQKQLHRVRKGETLGAIARRYGTTVRAIQQANGMGRRTLLSIGRVLEVPKGPPPRASRATRRVADSSGGYRVRRGDTLGVIARRFGVSVRQLQAWNGLGRSTRIIAGDRLRVTKNGNAPATTARRSAPVPTSTGNYTVRRGDTLWDIAQAHRISVNSLLRANGLSKRSVLRPGQKLTIPGRGASSATASRGTDGETHVVRRGESLYKIARRYGVTVERLCSLNGLAPDTVIHPGDKLAVR